MGAAERVIFALAAQRALEPRPSWLLPGSPAGTLVCGAAAVAVDHLVGPPADEPLEVAAVADGLLH
jgi:hypothetical protein